MNHTIKAVVAPATIVGGLAVGVAVFIVSALIESALTVYMWKKFGNPTADSHRGDRHV
jgi:hypothetical protein